MVTFCHILLVHQNRNEMNILHPSKKFESSCDSKPRPQFFDMFSHQGLDSNSFSFENRRTMVSTFKEQNVAEYYYANNQVRLERIWLSLWDSFLGVQKLYTEDQVTFKGLVLCLH